MKSMRTLYLVFVSVMVGLLFAIPTMAQQTPTVVDPNANITWPPPVYTVSGDFTIRGSANLPNMTNFFIEYRPLPEFDPALDPNAPEVWFPATLPSATAVQDGVLGIWDTSLADDGVYALRLTVRVRGSNPVLMVVSPVRVLNNPPPFAIGEGNVIQQPVAPTAPPVVVNTPIPTLDPSPRAVVTRSSVNVRQGDSTAYPVVTALVQGTTVPILGISNTGTGWYYIQLPDGRRGWVSPTVVQAEGDFSNVPRLAPPPLPVTPTPVPTLTPAAAVNFVAGIVVFDTPNPTCLVPFTVGFDVANNGTIPSGGGVVTLTDSRQADGSVQTSISQPLPLINPGTTVRINFPITMSTWFNETHIITLVIDSGNAVPEFNENDNRQTVSYVLQRGAC
jgi:uncharacterized protein YgiM (DUF1202 family)